MWKVKPSDSRWQLLTVVDEGWEGSNRDFAIFRVLSRALSTHLNARFLFLFQFELEQAHFSNPRL